MAKKEKAVKEEQTEVAEKEKLSFVDLWRQFLLNHLKRDVSVYPKLRGITYVITIQ